MEIYPELDVEWRELIGQVLQEKIRVDSVAGIGGYGVVFQAFHLHFHRPVALKCLRIPLGFTAPQIQLLLERFRDEARHLHDLVKEGAPVVGALEIGEGTFSHGGKFPYIVLDWMEGESFDDWCHRRQRVPMSLPEALRLLEPAARALHIAHRLGIVHRDIKPNNLFMVRSKSGEESIKVLDFGIAKVIQSSLSDKSLGTHDVGIRQFTAQYGAPEQFEHIRNGTGPWTDVFALALVLVWVLTGKEPLEGESVLQWQIAATRPDKRPTPNQRGAALAPYAEQVFQRALAVNPAERFGSAGEFWAALCDAIQETRPPWIPQLVAQPPPSSSGAGGLLLPSTSWQPPTPPLPGGVQATVVEPFSPPESNSFLPGTGGFPPSSRERGKSEPFHPGEPRPQPNRSAPSAGDSTSNVLFPVGTPKTKTDLTGTVPSSIRSQPRVRWGVGGGILLLVAGLFFRARDGHDPLPQQTSAASASLSSLAPKIPPLQNPCAGISAGDELLVFREPTPAEWEVSSPIPNAQRYFASKGMRLISDGILQDRFVKVRNYDKFYPCAAVKKP